MTKTHIRSYAITTHGDLMVNAYKGGDRMQLTKQYDDVKLPPRKELREEVYLDIYRYEDGRLAWTGSPNGDDVPAALTYSTLLQLFLADTEFDEGHPRAF